MRHPKLTFGVSHPFYHAAMSSTHYSGSPSSSVQKKLIYRKSRDSFRGNSKILAKTGKRGLLFLKNSWTLLFQNQVKKLIKIIHIIFSLIFAFSCIYQTGLGSQFIT